jgi:hypothetical protein
MGDDVNDANTDAQDDARAWDDSDPAPRAPEGVLGRMIRAFQVAMTDERIPADVVERVVNLIVYGDPCGACCRRTLDENVVEIRVHLDPRSTSAAVVEAVRSSASSRLYPPLALRVR